MFLDPPPRAGIASHRAPPGRSPSGFRSARCARDPRPARPPWRRWWARCGRR